MPALPDDDPRWDRDIRSRTRSYLFLSIFTSSCSIIRDKNTILTRNVRINEIRALCKRSRRQRVDMMRIELKKNALKNAR